MLWATLSEQLFSVKGKTNWFLGANVAGFIVVKNVQSLVIGQKRSSSYANNNN